MLPNPNLLMGLLTQYLRAVGWSITAAVGFLWYRNCVKSF